MDNTQLDNFITHHGERLAQYQQLRNLRNEQGEIQESIRQMEAIQLVSDMMLEATSPRVF